MSEKVCSQKKPLSNEALAKKYLSFKKERGEYCATAVTMAQWIAKVQINLCEYYSAKRHFAAGKIGLPDTVKRDIVLILFAYTGKNPRGGQANGQSRTPISKIDDFPWPASSGAKKGGPCLKTSH